MEEDTLVSVALCTYNGEKYIARQLDSILRQTHGHLEVIVVDDCSTDGTFNIVNNYAQTDERIKCFRNKINIGFNKNFEQAIKFTTGDYIAISDQDDIWLPAKLETLLKNIKDNWLIFSNSAYITEDDVIENKTLHGFDLKINNYKGILLANFVTGHTTLFNREALNYFLPFPENGFYDWWLGFVALYHKKMVFLNEVLTLHRIHHASVMQRRLTSVEPGSKENRTIATMLPVFAEYENLTAEDKVFIEKLNRAYNLNLDRMNSMPLLRLMLKYYKELFPNQKARKNLSRLNFAFKYCQKAKN
ncbi:MAG: glycosyl transferase [Mucilaginibacter sp.]|nr:glycosyl transferase [Mucilaginibacter sp.]